MECGKDLPQSSTFSSFRPFSSLFLRQSAREQHRLNNQSPIIFKTFQECAFVTLVKKVNQEWALTTSQAFSNLVLGKANRVRVYS